MSECKGLIGKFVQFGAPEDTIEGSNCLKTIMDQIKIEITEAKKAVHPVFSSLFRSFGLRMKSVKKDDGALIIFTTGTTGASKPALLS